MEFNEKDIVLIENYFDGNLSDSEQKDFETRLINDKAFAKVFKLRKSMPGFFNEFEEMESVRSEVNTAIRKEKAMIFGINRYWVFSVAASILILVAVFITIQFSQNQNGDLDQITKTETQDKLKTDHPPTYANKKIVADIEIVSPVEMQVFKSDEPIRLLWKSYLRYQAEIIITSSSFDKIDYRRTVRLSDTFFDLPKNKLKPGTYRWCLMDTIYCGSFRIEE